MLNDRLEIGSDFSLTSEVLSKALNCPTTSLLDNLFGPSGLFLSTCRSAIGIILDSLPPKQAKRAIVPGFTCHSVLSPFQEKGFCVYPYQLNLDLSINWEAFYRLISEISPSVVLFHPYFGFDTLKGGESAVKTCGDRGITVIEDLTQCMFSKMDTYESDFRIGSLRKWLPIPDGAFLSPHPGLQLSEDYELAELKIHAFLEKGRYLSGEDINKDCFRKKFAQAESIIDSRRVPFSMAKVSRQIFESMEFDKFCSSRYMNYTTLLERFVIHPEITVLFPKLQNGTVPFMFPVLVRKGREKLQRFMADHQIYPTVIWACPEVFNGYLSETVDTLFNTILCFHCDQRYTVADMNRIGDLLDYYFDSIS